MITARDLLSLERAAQRGEPVDLTEGHILMPASERRIPLRFSNPPKFCVDGCVISNGHLTCEGWAYDASSHAPVKRVFALVGDRLLPKAAPALRIDVRQLMGINYDNCGFRISARTKCSLVSGEALDFLAITNLGIYHFTAPCHSDVTAHMSPGDSYEVREASVLLNLAGRETRAASTELRLSIDTFTEAQNNLDAAGWCFGPEAPTRPLAIAFGAGGRILTPSTVCTTFRPDVAKAFGVAEGPSAFGYALNCRADLISAVDRSELEAIAITVDRGPQACAVVPAFPTPTRERKFRWFR